MQAPPSTIVITSCTNRKKELGDVVRLHVDDAVTSVEALARIWIARVNAVQRREPVRSLYQGRAFSEAKLAADAAGATLYVASAGHGLVNCEVLLPSYDLTVVAAPGNPLHAMLARLHKTPADWWQALTACFEASRSLVTLLNSHASKNCIVVLAMSSTYLAMLQDDLAGLNEHQISRLRIITSEFGVSKLPEHIRKMALPYDERLEGSVSYTGTRSDFAQRALRHFMVELRGHELPMSIARQGVISAMEALVRRSPPQRERKSDEAIEALIFQSWDYCGGSQSALLRWLRDQQLVSCEQSRFRLLWQRVQLKMTVASRGNNGKA